MRKAVFGLLSFSIVAALFLSCESPRTKDLRYFVEAIEENYAYLQVHERMEGLDWEAYKAGLSPDKYESLDETEYREFLSASLGGLNGHVGLIDDKFFSYMYPAFTSIANDPEKKRMYAPWLRTLEKTKSRKVYKLLEMPKLADLSGNERSPEIECRAIGNAAYIRVPIFDNERVAGDGAIISDFLAGQSSLNKLIIDIRGNSGGSDAYWTENLVAPFIEKETTMKAYLVFRGGTASMPFVRAQIEALRPIAELPKLANEAPELRTDNKWFGTLDYKVVPRSQPRRFLKIIVLMDRANFSSSETFVSFCKSTGYATLVGEPSGGDGIGFDPILLELPGSHLLMRMPAEASLNPDGSFNYETRTVPDIRANGEDALKLALEL